MIYLGSYNHFLRLYLPGTRFTWYRQGKVYEERIV
jgi:hypothetical protein